MGSARLYEDRETLADGTRYEMVATAVPESERYPEGVKYRFQYMDEDGRTLLRFDNFPDHPGVDRHHYHTPEGVYDDIEFAGIAAHAQRFYDAMDAHDTRYQSCPKIRTARTKRPRRTVS